MLADIYRVIKEMRRYGCTVPPTKLKDLAELIKHVDVEKSTPELLSKLIEETLVGDDFCKKVFRELLVEEYEKKLFEEISKEFEKEFEEINIWTSDDPLTKKVPSIAHKRGGKKKGDAYSYECNIQGKETDPDLVCKIEKIPTGEVVADVEISLRNSLYPHQNVQRFVEKQVRDFTELLNKARKTGDKKLEMLVETAVYKALETIRNNIDPYIGSDVGRALRNYVHARLEATKRILEKGIKRRNKTMIEKAIKLSEFLDDTITNSIRAEGGDPFSEEFIRALQEDLEFYGVRAYYEDFQDPKSALKIATALAETDNKVTKAYDLVRESGLKRAIEDARDIIGASLTINDKRNKYLTAIAKEKIRTALRRIRSEMKYLPERKGRRIDIRKTIKEAMRLGVPLNIYYQKKHKGKPGFSMVVDVSGSMVEYLPLAEAMYEVGKEATNKPWRIYYFTDRLYNSKNEIRRFLTDFEGLLRAVREGKLDKRSAIILFSDMRWGYSSVDPIHVLQELKNKGYRVYIINPEDEDSVYSDPGDSVSIEAEKIFPVYYLGDDAEEDIAKALVDIANRELYYMHR